MKNNSITLGWGIKSNTGAEIWDSEPVFKNDRVLFKDWCKLLFFPKKWFLYRYVNRHLGNKLKDNLNVNIVGWQTELIRILDVGCGTGASLIDLKKMFGRSVEVIGVDVVELQVEIAREKIKQNAVWAEVKWYDGEQLPFADNYFDAIYTSDVLGHVEKVSVWLKELNRVLKPGGALAMFAESKLGRHAYVRNYLMRRGLNTDPHAEFHISLYSKKELKGLLFSAGFNIKKMYSAFWASFLVHPEDFFCHPERSGAKRNEVEGSPCIHDERGDVSTSPYRASLNMTIVLLKFINKILYKIKKKFHPYSTALCELYGLMEMYVVGRFVEVQGYIILARKK